MEEQVKRTRKSKAEAREAKIELYQAEIVKHEKKIEELKRKIADLNSPSTTYKDITSKMKELGISPDDALKAIEKLGKK